MEIINFFVEASANVLGVWWYMGGDLLFFAGIPANIFFHFVMGGYVFSLFYDEAIRRFESKFGQKKIFLTGLIGVSAFSAIGDTVYAIYDIIFFQPWWTTIHIFFIWIFLYYINLKSFEYFKVRFAKNN